MEIFLQVLNDIVWVTGDSSCGAHFWSHLLALTTPMWISQGLIFHGLGLLSPLDLTLEEFYSPHLTQPIFDTHPRIDLVKKKECNLINCFNLSPSKQRMGWSNRAIFCWKTNPHWVLSITCPSSWACIQVGPQGAEFFIFLFYFFLLLGVESFHKGICHMIVIPCIR